MKNSYSRENYSYVPSIPLNGISKCPLSIIFDAYTLYKYKVYDIYKKENGCYCGQIYEPRFPKKKENFFKNKNTIDVINIINSLKCDESIKKTKLLVSPPYNYQNHVIESIIYKYFNGKKNNICLLYGPRESGKTSTANILASKLKNVYNQKVNISYECNLDKNYNNKYLQFIKNKILYKNDCHIIVINDIDKLIKQVEKNKNIYTNTSSPCSNFVSFFHNFNIFYDKLDTLKKQKNLIVIFTSESLENIYIPILRRIDSFYKFYRNNNTNNFNAIET